MLFHDKVRENIDKYGQHLFGVFAGVDDTDANTFVPFIYTIGNHEKGLPELLCVGAFPSGLVGQLLNDFGKQMRDGKITATEGMIDIGYSYPVKARWASDTAKSHFTIQAGQFHGTEDYRVLQLMLCDAEGKYPGDEGVHEAFDVEQV